MHDVDFLPPKYRDLSARRNIKFSRVLVVGAIALAIVGAAVMQNRSYRQLAAEIEAIEAFHATAEDQSQDLKQITERLESENKMAALVTYLQHPWPRTQLLAAVIDPLPESLSLDQISFSNQKLEQKKATTHNTRGKRKTTNRDQEKAAAEKLLPAERDLAHLRKHYDPSHTVITVVGRTSDRAALYYYLGRLGESDLIVKAELKSLESALDRRSYNRGRTSQAQPPAATVMTKFVARLVIRRAHGQSGSVVDLKQQQAT